MSDKVDLSTVTNNKVTVKKKKKTEIYAEQKYTQRQMLKAISIARLTGSPARAAKDTGVEEYDVARWLKGEIPRFLQGSKFMEEYTSKEMGDIAFIKDEALVQIYDKIKSASAAQAATIYGILSDKQRALQEMSANFSNNTFIFADNTMSLDDRLDLIDRVSRRRDGYDSVQSDSTVKQSDSLDADFTIIDNDNNDDSDNDNDD